MSSPIKKLLHGFATKRQLALQLQALQAAYTSLEERYLQMVSTTHFDERSKEIRAFQERYANHTTQLSAILLKNLTEEDQSMLLNGGSTQGIEIDTIAIYKNQLLGRICEVYPYHCKLQLVTDKKSHIAAYCASTKAAGICKGAGVFNRCTLDYVSHLSAVQNNDYVLTSGKGLVIPEGFCLGKIEHLVKEDLTYKIELSPLIDFKSIEFCLLIPRSTLHDAVATNL